MAIRAITEGLRHGGVSGWIRKSAAALALAALCGGAGIGPAAAQTPLIEVTDLAGRTVKVKAGAQRIILGEGRLMYGLGILDTEKPFQRIAGWSEDMILYDPGSYRAFKAKFPEAEKLPRFGSAFSGDFSVEKALSLAPDVVLMPLSGIYKARETGLIDKFEKAGVPVVFIDLREEPLVNTVPSILIAGQIYGREKQAQEFVNFYLRESRKIMVRVAQKKDKDRVPVFFERAAGYQPDQCCLTFGNANLGAVLQAAGGLNWGTTKFAGLGGEVNQEVIFADNLPVIIGTGADWAESTPGSRAVPFGYETNPVAVQEALKGLANRKGWPTLKAVQTKRFYGVYHQFYTSPSHVVALQVFAKWLYPDEFKDLDPQATWAEYHQRFSPIPLTGQFWAQLQ